MQLLADITMIFFKVESKKLFFKNTLVPDKASVFARVSIRPTLLATAACLATPSKQYKGPMEAQPQFIYLFIYFFLLSL